MHIYPINNTNYNKKPSFKRWERETRDARNILVNRNNTLFFRQVDFFHNLTNLLSENFKNIPKVNVYCYGCSDGSEAFTFAMSMLSNKKEANPQKFFPIKASDIDPVAIQKANNNDYHITLYEKEKINVFTDNQYDRFISQPFGEPADDKKGTKVFVKKELYDCVDFKIKNILTNYKEIEPKNSVVMVRNFWPYIDYEDRMIFFRNLYQHLDSNSYVIIGDFDQQGIGYALQGNFEKDIEKMGFKPTSMRYVFTK